MDTVPGSTYFLRKKYDPIYSFAAMTVLEASTMADQSENQGRSVQEALSEDGKSAASGKSLNNVLSQPRLYIGAKFIFRDIPKDI